MKQPDRADEYSARFRLLFSETVAVCAGGHPRFLLKELGKIMGIIAAANFFCDDLNLFAGSDVFFGPHNPNIGQVVGKFAACFLKESFADVIHIHKENLLGDKF